MPSSSGWHVTSSPVSLWAEDVLLRMVAQILVERRKVGAVNAAVWRLGLAALDWHGALLAWLWLNLGRRGWQRDVRIADTGMGKETDVLWQTGYAGWFVFMKTRSVGSYTNARSMLNLISFDELFDYLYLHRLCAMH